MHPEATDDPATLRWVIPRGVLPALGTVISAPGELGELVRIGRAHIEVSPVAVLITLHDPLTWRRDGPALRTALAAALAEPQHWVSERTPPSDLDARLRRLTQEAIAGAPGDYVRSHGGSVDLVDVSDGHVTLRLSGVCGSCPASTFTLHGRFEAELRRACPELVSVGLAHT